MKILITGATGFIGGHLRALLRARGHALVLAGRRAPSTLAGDETWLPLDFVAAPAAAALAPSLAGIDVAVNAAGIFREVGEQTFENLHSRGPIALFEACARAGVRRIVQVSALGADAEATSRFHLSKRAADDFLRSIEVEAVVAQPSLVYGGDGASARRLLAAATMPLLFLPAGGRQRVQPIHVDDASAALAALCEQPLAFEPTIALVGAEALSLGEYLQTLRASLGMRRAAVLAIPSFAVGIATRLVDALLRRPFAAETWAMLQRGNEAAVSAIARLLGHVPLAPDRFIAAEEGPLLRTRAQLDWLLPLLRLSIAVVWIATGLVSFGTYPVADSFALLERAGVPASLRPLALYGAAALDLLLGLATLALPRRRWLWRAQIALILAYTLIITVRLPEFWLHPYGPVLKNLPMLAALWLLLELERGRETRR
jgi:uncharacterized protein YbjT (DUF2867 family)